MNKHRPWPVPDRSWSISMCWHDVLFLHWTISPEGLKPHIPDELHLDTFDGTAWIGVIPFRMSRIRPRFCPSVPHFSAFPEINIRTYVTDGEHPGVWFFTLDAERWLAVQIARLTYNLNYRWADMDVSRSDRDRIDYYSERTGSEPGQFTFSASYKPGRLLKTDAGRLEHFLTERYCLYAEGSEGTVYRGDINHEPWSLRQAAVELNGLKTDEPGSSQFDRTPDSVLYSPEISVKAWSPDVI